MAREAELLPMMESPVSQPHALAPAGTMIKGIFVINNHGKPRLIKDFQRMVSGPAAAA